MSSGRKRRLVLDQIEIDLVVFVNFVRWFCGLFMDEHIAVVIKR